MFINKRKISKKSMLRVYKLYCINIFIVLYIGNTHFNKNRYNSRTKYKIK